MRKRLDVTKSKDGDVFVPMTTTEGLPMALRKSVEVAD
jgi:hypothetical protein